MLATQLDHPTDITRPLPPAHHPLNDDDRRRYSQLLEKGKIRSGEEPDYRDIMSSRGCILRCSFCSVAHLRGEKQRYRRKTIDQVVTEIAQALDDGIEEIRISSMICLPKPRPTSSR